MVDCWWCDSALEEVPAKEDMLLPCIEMPAVAWVMDDVFVFPAKPEGRDAPESVPMG
jgi:hypothetical protein